MTSVSSEYIEKIIARFDDVVRRLLGEPNTKNHDEWRYGRNGSLKVNIAGALAGTWHDFENERKGGVWDFLEIYGEMKREGAEEWLERELGIRRRAARFNIVATYDYVDETGAVLFQVCRLDPKDFRQRHSNGKGDWIWNLTGVRRVVYHLDELAAAANGTGGAPPDAHWGPVFIVEGEKDADRLRQWNLLATCNPMGAGKWAADYNEYFRNANVVVIPDNDEAGRQHANDVARHLLPLADTVKILPMLVPEKGDVSDAITDGLTQSELLELVECCDPLTKQVPPEPANPSEKEPWPEIEAEAFHGLAGEISLAIAPLTEADPIAILAQTLAAFGSAFGRNAYYRVGDVKHYPNIYQILSGRTSKGRKGTSYAPVEAQFRLADPTWADRCVKSGLSSGEGIIHNLHDGIWVNERTKERGQKATYERILKEPPVSDKRLFVIEQELASALTVMKRQGNTLSQVLRLGWDGLKLQTLVKHNAETATGAHLSVIGHITIEELRSLLDQVAITSGLVNRFLIILVRRAQELPFPGVLDPEDAQAYASRIKSLLTTMDWRRSEVTFSPAAKELWEAEYHELSAEKPGLFGFAVNRAEAQTARLSMIYALLDGTYAIEPVHLRAGLAFWRYCEASAKYIIGDFIGDPLADDILRALRQTRPDGMSRREIYNFLGHNKSGETIGAALAMLLKHGKAQRHTKKPEGGRGRPTEIWVAT